MFVIILSQCIFKTFLILLQINMQKSLYLIQLNAIINKFLGLKIKINHVVWLQTFIQLNLRIKKELENMRKMVMNSRILID